ncbi:mpv17-like protein [Ixodes scapularis]|uniref:mpv17-like protein n=1 Tax=Ixodes scapularis TaxID=6945 RepID=UPI001A9F25DC|nr:mpv17-like protein [Ixodes scapularis]
MEHLIRLYQGELNTQPAITQVLTIATMLLAGDIISQTFFQQKTTFDARQAVNFFIIGLFYSGPLGVAWFGLVERLVVKDGVAAVVIKVLAGQLMFSPLFTLGLLVFYGLLKGECWMDIMKSIRTKYVALMISRYMVYPVAQFVNFEFVPVVYRPMFGVVLGFFWNIYLSRKTNQVEDEPPIGQVQKDSFESD